MPPGKDKDFGLSPEITRLSAMLARDPNSKLFIPLAEEYIKVGMAEEAVMTLEEGLKANPFYMSARVMLGKAYLEKGDADKAREQFETVVKSVPDNLLAHRRLGEIYRNEGRLADAARSFKMVTLLNPRDEESKRLLAELESAHAPGPTPVPPAAPEPAGETEVESHMTESEPEGAASNPAPADMPAFDLAEVEEAEEAGPEAETEPAPPPQAGPDIIEMPVPDNMVTLEETLQSKQDITPVDAPGDKAAGYGLQNKEALDDIFASYQDAPSGEDKRQDAAGVYEIEEDISAFEMDGFKVEPVKVEPAKKEPFETETLAELYISQGFYDRAINIYKNLLSGSPDDKALKQKLEDLYLLASVNSVKTAEAARKEADDAVAVYEPVDFEALDETDVREEPVAEAEHADFDEGAVRRLEQFLENVRRKAG